MNTGLQPVEGATGGAPTIPEGASGRRVRPLRAWTAGLVARPWDALAVTGMLAAAVLVTSSLWADPSGRMLSRNARDHAFFEWMLAHGARVVSQGEYPFVSTRMGFPDGLNAMANTSILGLSIPLSPITLLLGTGISFAVLLTLAFAATGISWYFLFSRHLTDSGPIALLGAAFAAFAPGLVTHGNGHPNIVFQFLVPWIVWYTLKLREPGRTVRNGVVLGLLITWQAFINEEILLFTALAVGLYVAILALVRRELRADVVSFLKGLAVAGLVALTLLAYPLWIQFFGPHSYRRIGMNLDRFSNDVVSFFAFSYDSLGGSIFGGSRFAPHPTEENTFFGLPLVVLVVGLAWWLRRDSRAIAAAAVGLVFALASLGPVVKVNGQRVGAGPWAALMHLPVLDKVVATRLGLVITPVIAVLLVLAANRVRTLAANTPAPSAAALRLGWVTLVVATLLPLLPTPLHTTERLPVPSFFTAGIWREYVDDDRSIVFTPPASGLDAQALMWAAADTRVSIANGYFLVPDPVTGASSFSPPFRHYGELLYRVSLTGRAPAVTEQDRRLAIDDLRYWRAAVIVQLPARYTEVVRATTSRLLGVEPILVHGALVWDVRSLTATR